MWCVTGSMRAHFSRPSGLANACVFLLALPWGVAGGGWLRGNSGPPEEEERLIGWKGETHHTKQPVGLPSNPKP